MNDKIRPLLPLFAKGEKMDVMDCNGQLVIIARPPWNEAAVLAINEHERLVAQEKRLYELRDAALPALWRAREYIEKAFGDSYSAEEIRKASSHYDRVCSALEFIAKSMEETTKPAPKPETSSMFDFDISVSGE